MAQCRVHFENIAYFLFIYLFFVFYYSSVFYYNAAFIITSHLVACTLPTDPHIF